MLLLRPPPRPPCDLAQEAKRISDEEANPWTATIVALAIEDEQAMEGLVRLLVRAQLVRKDPLAKGKIEGVLANGREEESWCLGHGNGQTTSRSGGRTA